MVKNSFAKRLAVAVASALVATGLAITPAGAAENIGLAPTAGSSYNTLSTSTFSLQISLPSSANNETAKYLKFKITNNSAVSSGTQASYSASVIKNGTATESKAIKADALTVSTAPAVLTSTASNAILAPSSSDYAFAAVGEVTQLKLSVATRVAEDVSLDVQAWIDSNNNNVLESGEDTSPVRTVKFVNASAIQASVTLETLTLNDNDLKATVAFGDDINLRQIGTGDVQVVFTGMTNGSPATASATWDSAKSEYYAASSSGITVSAGTEVTATLYIDTDAGDADTATDDAARTTSKAKAAASQGAKAAYGQLVNAAHAKNVTTVISASDEADFGFEDGVTSDTAQGAGSIKLDAGTPTSFQIYVGSDTESSIATPDVPVVVTVTSTALSSDDLVTAAGKPVYNGKSATFTVTTGTDGFASFDIDSAKADNAETFTVSYTVPGHDAVPYTVTVTSGTYSLYSALGDSARTITAGSSFSVDYLVVDEFGKAPKDGTMYVSVSSSGSVRTKAASFAYTLPVVGGKVTANVTDNGSGTGTFTLNAQLKKNTDNSPVGTAVTHTITIGADSVAASLTLSALTYGTDQKDLPNDVDNTAKLLLSKKTFANFDSRTAAPTETAPAIDSDKAVNVEAVVKNAAATAVAGTTVTFAGAGLLFVSGDRYAVGSITVLTGSTGKASVAVYSNNGGKQTVTVTSASFSQTVDLTYETSGTTAASFDVIVPATTEPGKTVDVKVLVKDKYSNPAKGVAVTLKSTGPGYLLERTGTTDADGYVTTKLLVGATEEGAAVVTATISIDGEDTAKSATIAVSVNEVNEVNAVIGSFKGRWAVRIENGKGSTIAVRAGGRWFKYEAPNDNYLFSRKSRVGADLNVKVYVDGSLQEDKTITVK